MIRWWANKQSPCASATCHVRRQRDLAFRVVVGNSASRVIEPAIRRLLHAPLDTFEKLEVALALYRAPGRALSITEIAHLAVLTPEQTRRAVEDLHAAKLVNGVGGLVHLLLQPPDEDAFRALAELDAHDSARIVALMSEVALDKIRGMTAHAFSEGFHGRKKSET